MASKGVKPSHAGGSWPYFQMFPVGFWESQLPSTDGSLRFTHFLLSSEILTSDQEVYQLFGVAGSAPRVPTKSSWRSGAALTCLETIRAKLTEF
jgi:hypothetical protein